MAAALHLRHIKHDSRLRVVRAEAPSLAFAKRRAPTSCPDGSADFDLIPVPGLNHFSPLPADGAYGEAPAGEAAHADEPDQPGNDRRAGTGEGRQDDRREKTRRTS